MERFWLKSYPADILPCINPDIYSSLTHFLHSSFEQYAHQPAFASFNTQITYQNLWKKSLHLAAYFQARLHLSKGDRLAVMLPNILQYPITLLAALHLGLVCVNINPLYTERELLSLLNDSAASAIVVLANVAPVLTNVVAATPIRNIIVTEAGDELPYLKRILINNYFKYIKKTGVSGKRFVAIGYRQALQEGAKIAFKPVHITLTDIAFLQYTGGTTGLPKGAILTHRNMIANIMQCTAWIGHALERGKEVVVAALPLYHIFSLTTCCFVFMQLGGLSLLIPDPRDIKAVVKQLVRTHFSVFVGVNTLYQALLGQQAFKSLSFAAMKLALAGGMPITKSVADQWQQVTGKPLIMGYGLTEASPVVTINPLNTTHFNGSIGLPVPSTEVVILNEAGEVVLNGMPGELCVKGPQVMQGYWQQPAETQAMLSDDGWLHTGDIAIMNEQGYLYLIDRKKDIILVSGFNVYPIEIEEVIASHPGVAEVAVVGVPHALSGESIKAFIVCKDSALTTQDIKQFCASHLTGYKQPKIIEFCDALPKSNMGKLLRRRLRGDKPNDA